VCVQCVCVCVCVCEVCVAHVARVRVCALCVCECICEVSIVHVARVPGEPFQNEREYFLNARAERILNETRRRNVLC
jgi:hypothetical protein